MTWQKKAQFVTVTQAMQKLEKFCTYQERSQKQVHEKCRSLGLTEAETGEVMLHLLQNDYLNESRFAFAFVRGKSKIKNWGSEKIKQGLKMAGVSDSLIKDSLSQLQEEDMDVHLDKWARKKLKSLRYTDLEIDKIIRGDRSISYEEKQKVKTFLYGKGYKIDAQLSALAFLSR